MVDNSLLDESCVELERRIETEHSRYRNIEQQVDLKNEILLELEKEIANVENKNNKTLTKMKQEYDQQSRIFELQVKEMTISQEQKEEVLQNLQNQLNDLEKQWQEFQIQECNEMSLDDSVNTSLSQSKIDNCIEEKKELKNVKTQLEENLEVVSCENLRLETEIVEKKNILNENEQHLNELQCNKEEKYIPNNLNIAAESHNVEDRREETPVPVSLYDEMEKKGVSAVEKLRSAIKIYNDMKRQKEDYENQLEQFMDEYGILKASKDHEKSTHELFLKNAKYKLSNNLKELTNDLMFLSKEVNKLKLFIKDEQFIEDPPCTVYLFPMMMQVRNKMNENNKGHKKQKTNQAQIYNQVLQKRFDLYRTQVQVLEWKLKNLILKQQTDDLFFDQKVDIDM